LIEMMLAVGLGVSLRDAAQVFTDVRLVSRAAIANYFLVPAAAIVLLFLFRTQPEVAAGFLLVAVCPGAPFGPPLVGLAKADLHVSVGLMVLLAASSAIVAPLLMTMLLPLVAHGARLEVDFVKVLKILLVAQLLPLAIGLAIKWKRPELAARFVKPATRLMGILSLLVFGLIVQRHFEALRQIRATGFLGISLLVALCVVAGLLVGGPLRSKRWAVALTTGTRNVGVALAIATESFPGTAVVTSVVVFAIFQTVLLALLALVVRRVRA